MPDSVLAAIAAATRRARHIVVLTGAGISAESGLSTFRGPRDALWSKHDPMQLATPEAFARDPETVTRWYDWRRINSLAAQPNPGHIALAQLEALTTARGDRFALLTQNVDRLHHRAGSRNVHEIHGSIHVWRCTRTGRDFEPPPEPFMRFPPPSPFAHDDPRAILRPGVVWFGEPLPSDALRTAADAMESCDLFFSIGTSSVVFPAAGFIERAIARGDITVEVNPEPTPISQRVAHTIRAKAGEWLPMLVTLV